MSNSTTGTRSPGPAGAAPLTGGLRLALLVLLLVGVWLLFAPPRFGGAFSYIFVFGESMEPTVEQGDLVLLRSADRYDVGDVVAYDDPLIGRVFHRVVARDGLTYITQGDNRPNPDPFQPLHADILGEQWIHLPNGGDVITAVQRPRNTMLLLGATVVLSISTQAVKPVRRRRRRRTAEASQSLAYGSDAGDMLLSLGVALVVTGAVLGTIGWTRSTTDTATLDVPYSQIGEFSYGGVGPASLYDDATIESGDPVFTNLITQLPVSYRYQISPELLDPLMNASGTISLEAVLTQENGWQRTFPIQATTSFTGAEATVSGVLDIAALRAEAATMQAETGLFFLEFGVSLRAHVESEAMLAGQPLTESLDSQTRFRLTSFDLRLLTRDEPLVESSGGLTTRTEFRERVIDVPGIGWDLTYTTIRRLAIWVALGGGVLLLTVGVTSLLARRGGAAARINARYQRMLVSVRARDIDFSGRIVGVSTFEDLVRIATADGLLILHTESAAADHYMVVEPEATYVYEVPADRDHPHDHDAWSLPDESATPGATWDRTLFDEVFNEEQDA